MGLEWEKQNKSLVGLSDQAPVALPNWVESWLLLKCLLEQPVRARHRGDCDHCYNETVKHGLLSGLVPNVTTLGRLPWVTPEELAIDALLHPVKPPGLGQIRQGCGGSVWLVAGSSFVIRHSSS